VRRLHCSRTLHGLDSVPGARATGGVSHNVFYNLLALLANQATRFIVFFCIKQGITIVIEEVPITNLINDTEEWKYKSTESPCNVPPVARAPGTGSSPCYVPIWSIGLATKRQSSGLLALRRFLSLTHMRSQRQQFFIMCRLMPPWNLAEKLATAVIANARRACGNLSE